MITIATNMAGRGTDIVLGGNVENQIKIIDADESIPEPDKLARAKSSCTASGKACTTA